MTALLALLALQTAPATVTLGTYRFDGRDVPAVVPAAPGPIPADAHIVTQDGEKFLVSPEGRVLRRFRFEGGWSEVRGGFAAAKAAMAATTPEWRVKVFVLPRIDLLDADAQGVARIRRSTMETNEVAMTAESVARFAAMAEAAGQGKVRVRIEFEVDADTAYFEVAKGRPAFDAAFLREYVRPRINGGLYEAEDKQFRGPFDSVFVIHGGLCGPMPMTEVSDAPVSPVAFYGEGFAKGPWALSISLYNGWVQHLAYAARKAGYRVPDGLIHPILPTPGEFAQGFAGLLDFESLPLTPGHDETPTDAFVAHQALPPLAPRPVPTVSPGPIPAVPLQPNRGGDAIAAALIPDGDTAKSIPVQRQMRIKDVQDPERGSALEVRIAGLVRTGEALLLGQRNGPALFDPAVHPYLSFFIKAANPEPMNVRIVPTGGRPERVVRLFGAWDPPAEVDDGQRDSSLSPSGAGWSPIVIDLRKLNTGPVAAVILESNEWVGAWESVNSLPPTVLIDDLQIGKTAPGPETAPIQTAESPAQTDSRFAAAAGANADAGQVARLVELLKSADQMVLLNAARAFKRIKSAAAEPGLIDLSRNIDARVAEAAIDALAFQASDAAWSALKRAVEVGPFDYTRCFAAKALRGKPDFKNVGTISLMLTARSWRGRMWAAESIGVMANEPQQMVLMAFLHEIDPAVRIAATRAAHAANEEVCKRFLWSAVNDPSDELRALSAIRLVQSGIAKYVAEGLKGIRDESVGMRKRFLEMAIAQPAETYRSALRLAVLDTSPTVRALALRAFATLPGAVTRAELAQTWTDADPRVQAALSELKKAKNIDGT